MYDLAGDVIDGLSAGVGGLSREIAGVIDAIRWQLPRLKRLATLRDDSPVSLSEALAEQAEAIPEAPFFLWEGRAFTYREADEQVNRVARALAEHGVRRAQHVGLLMDNHPDYLTVVAALNRLGAVAVLLPADAGGLSLEQAMNAGRLAHLVVGPHHVACARGFGRPALLVGQSRRPEAARAGVVVLDGAIDAASPEPPDEVEELRAADVAMLMFTSGTTGLPKAARITNRRTILAGLGTAAACALTPADTVYCCLPLHHATGLLVACAGALVGGARLQLAPRFSPAQFWSDVRRSGATVVCYVGELGRVLVSTPPSADERNHPVRVFLGNGLRADVWRQLVARFGGVSIVEFYGSTEGNVLLVNLSGEKPGSVGRDLSGGSAVALCQYDLETGRAVRGADGRAVRVPVGKPGLLVARIHDSNALGYFDGYTDASATRARIERDLAQPGDAWFSTGDVLRQDADGDFWFVDRLGDTFRWKGENVSTDQVAQVVAQAPQVELVTVYGVAVPGREGRVGMAAVQLRPGEALDGAALWELVERHLTPAARPRFVRVCSRLELTASFKPSKLALREEGVDPARVRDPIYVADDRARAYVQLPISSVNPFAGL
jgi:acyl-CoA synthetase (AMP-forming)/AMP-acid ligase II